MKAQRRGLAELTTYRLHLLNRIFDSGIATEYREALGLSLGEARAIAAVGHFGPLWIKDLGRHANLEKSKASRAVESLLRKSLFLCERDAADARAVRVSLTALGHQHYGVIIEIARRRHDALLAPLSSQEMAVFNGFLDRLVSNAQSH